MSSTFLNPHIFCRPTASHSGHWAAPAYNQSPYPTCLKHSCGLEHVKSQGLLLASITRRTTRRRSELLASESSDFPLSCVSHSCPGKCKATPSEELSSEMNYRPRSRTPWGKVTGLEGILYGSATGRSSSQKRRIVTRHAQGESEGGSAVEAGDEEETSSATDVTMQRLKVLVSCVLTVVFAVSNRVLYKMALVPLKEYPFFLAQVTTFGYVAVYFSALMYRRRAGIVTEEMMSFPKRRFAAMGALEAVGLASGMAAAAMLPGALIPILGQVFIVWQLLMSYVILGKRYTSRQVAGCLLVIAGVISVVASGSGAGESLQGVGLFWPLIMIISAAFPAGASILKEGVFREAKYRLKGGSLDLFVVNSFGSGFQALFVFLLLPLLSRMRGIPFDQLPAYFREGTACFLNMGTLGSGCEGAPLLPLAYVACNLAFNIAALNLLKCSSAVVASLCITLAVPLTIVAFTVPLPYLGRPAPLPPGFFSGSAILILGLALYNFGAVQKAPPVVASKED